MNADHHRLLVSGLILAGILAMCPTAGAIPTLQLYSPGATYNAETESWVQIANPFVLQVVGCTTPSKVHVIDDLWLYLAVPEPYATDAWIDELRPWSVNILPVTLNEGADPEDFVGGYTSVDALPWFLDEDDLNFNQTPPVNATYEGSTFPSHGIYPAPFWEVPLPPMDLVDPDNGGGVDVYNYDENYNPENPGSSDTDTGAIQYYLIDYTPVLDSRFLIHVDATGWAHNGQSVWRFAPFSHDADYPGTDPDQEPPIIPEPSTILLLGSGLVLFGIRARVRRRGNRRSRR